MPSRPAATLMLASLTALAALGPPAQAMGSPVLLATGIGSYTITYGSGWTCSEPTALAVRYSPSLVPGAHETFEVHHASLGERRCFLGETFAVPLSYTFLPVTPRCTDDDGLSHVLCDFDTANTHVRMEVEAFGTSAGSQVTFSFREEAMGCCGFTIELAGYLVRAEVPEPSFRLG